MEAVIRVNMDNAAFEFEPQLELAGILRRVAGFLEKTPYVREWNLRDTNGNTVGTMEIQ